MSQSSAGNDLPRLFFSNDTIERRKQGLQSWLANLHLERYFEQFLLHNFTSLEDVRNITPQQLSEVGVLPGHRKKLLLNKDSISQCSQQPAPLPSPSVNVESDKVVRRKREFDLSWKVSEAFPVDVNQPNPIDEDEQPGGEGNLTKEQSEGPNIHPISDTAQQNSCLTKEEKELQEWLHSIHLGDYFATLLAGSIHSLRSLSTVTNQQLVKFGVALPGHRKKLFIHLNKLKEETDSSIRPEQQASPPAKEELPKESDEERIARLRRATMRMAEGLPPEEEDWSDEDVPPSSKEDSCSSRDWRMFSSPKRGRSKSREGWSFLGGERRRASFGGDTAGTEKDTIDVSRNNLYTFPAVYFMFRKTCHRAILSYNYISTIPANIIDWLSRDFGWNHLAELDLSHNKLVELPENMHYLCHLQAMNVSFNELTVLPHTVGKLEYLETLNLDSNLLQTLPRSLADMSSLQVLTVTNNPMVFPSQEICKKGIIAILTELLQNPVASEITTPRRENTSTSQEPPHQQYPKTSDVLLARRRSKSFSGLSNVNRLGSQAASAPLEQRNDQRERKSFSMRLTNRGEDFTRVLHDKTQRMQFAKFLEKELSTENLVFWLIVTILNLSLLC